MNKPPHITEEDVKLRRLTEICESFATHKGSEYAMKLKAMAHLYLLCAQAHDIAQHRDEKAIIHVLDTLGTLLVGSLPLLSGVEPRDFATVARAAHDDGVDVQELVRKKLGL